MIENFSKSQVINKNSRRLKKYYQNWADPDKKSKLSSFRNGRNERVSDLNSLPIIAKENRSKNLSFREKSQNLTCITSHRNSEISIKKGWRDSSLKILKETPKSIAVKNEAKKLANKAGIDIYNIFVYRKSWHSLK